MPLDAMARADGVVIRGAGDLARQLLEGATLGLGNQQGGEDAAEHEEGEDLHHVVEPGRVVARVGAADAERAEDALRDDGSHFAGGGGEAVGGAAVPGREAFARHDEGGGVGACGGVLVVSEVWLIEGGEVSGGVLDLTEVEEELGEYVEGE